MACGKGGDINKWLNINVSDILGIDISEDNIHNIIDGACARYLKLFKKKEKKLEYTITQQRSNRR